MIDYNTIYVLYAVYLHTQHIYVYIYMCIYVCKCMCV